MVQVAEYFSFDINNLDLNNLIANQTDIWLYDNVFESFNGVQYEDILEIEYYSGGYYYSVFGGTGFTATAQGIPTGGTVTGILEYVMSGGFPTILYAIEGFSTGVIPRYHRIDRG